MGKHTKQKNSRINLRALSTGVLAIGLLATQTAGASAAVTAGAGNAGSFERTAITVPLDTTVTPVVQAPANAAYSLNMQATGGVNRTSVEVKAEADRVAAEKAAAVEAERVAAEAQAAQVAATQAQQAAAVQPVSYNTPAPAGVATLNNTAAAPSAPVASTGRSAAIYSAAMAQLGVNQDCTMLATNALAAAGINFHDWPAGYMSLGTITNNPVPGDLIYYADGGMGMAHIAVYAGPGANGQGMAIHGGFNGNSTVLAPAQLGSGAVFIHVA